MSEDVEWTPFYFIVLHKKIDPPPVAFGYPNLRHIEGPYLKDEAVARMRFYLERDVRVSLCKLFSELVVTATDVRPRTAPMLTESSLYAP